MRPLLGSMLLAAALVGCRNQASGTFTNPFLTPSKVPPPGTRVLVPGTAQPYYPGDPAPVAAPLGGAPTIGAPVIGAPVAGAPMTAAPTGTPIYSPAPATGFSPTSQPLTTPPGGWPYPPQSSVNPGSSLNGDAVRVPADQQGLRFAGAEIGMPTQAGMSTSAPPINAVASVPPGARSPIQSLLPLGGSEAAGTGAGSNGAVAVGNPSPSPSLQGSGMTAGATQLAQREVTAAEYFAPRGASTSATLASATASRDGFRPQGSPARTDATSDPGFRAPSVRAGTTPSAEDASRFVAGENYDTLRGQLEYWPVTGEWSLRYLAEGAAVDSLGGRVMIENPQVLANLQPGELVSVRGQLFGKTTETGAMQPTYRVSGVQRQRK